MGSLFDGIGGFPLAASRHGIKTLWASEIEPFPIAVTQLRFPDMIHVGDITKLNGAAFPPGGYYRRGFAMSGSFGCRRKSRPLRFALRLVYGTNQSDEGDERS